MRVALAIVVPLVAALLQGSVVPFISIAGSRPNLVLLAAASWAVAAGAREAVWWAFLGGLAADLLSGGPLGATAFAALIPVAAVGLHDDPLRPRSVVIGALLVGVASLAAGVLYVVILAMAGTAVGDFPLLVASAVSTGIYNGVLAIATYPLARMVRRATEKQASFTRSAW
ncbi:MAG: rod shape-determining protein MreD [Chloroflexi bacterium]|nr:MAG: rod shape-determining protein MreD [Chloroflexota bacterium]TMC30552.1 MAG: rod shape-determining protein MreD [Chloroflexota bacterium]TMC33158.1 MAG: rod shape-determining protein MreD [Chloroflexota bacterium]TMC55839.1 MAG: rod shape-determining protein MreD [Chloroflexota bacterium]TME36924.1 MAG: rod shape-determining protein MreD [Chloroflexota bacterium]